MKRRDFLKAAGAGAVSLVMGRCTDRLAASAPTSSKKRPNIVFIVVDDMGWADLGCYGGKHIKTPNINRMAKEGLRFTDAYSGCTVCAPARSVLMTGLHMGHTSVRGNTGGIALRDEDVTVAEVLKTSGYTTGGVTLGPPEYRRSRALTSSSGTTTRCMRTTTGRSICGATAGRYR
jgi:hypothetical protein